MPSQSLSPRGAAAQTAPRLALVVAMGQNHVIGRLGTLPWRMPSDLKLFRRLTLDKPVIMGRRTFASIGRPLPRRRNIVVTRDPTFHADGVVISPTVEDALETARVAALELDASEIMVIGGGEVYRALIARADRVYLTVVDATPEGDTLFPILGPEWNEVGREPLPRSDEDDHDATLLILDRVDKP